MNLPKGTFTALITPFRDGRINAKAYEADVARQIAAGINGLVACGTTAETPALDVLERDWLIRAAVVGADGKIPVVVGTGTNSTASTIAATRHARKLGADAALVVTPYYSRPSQEGLYQHFEAVALRSDLPIILYNVPARTGVDLSVDTVVRLSELAEIVGIKEARGDPERCRVIKQRVPKNSAFIPAMTGPQARRSFPVPMASSLRSRMLIPLSGAPCARMLWPGTRLKRAGCCVCSKTCSTHLRWRPILAPSNT
jgi:4-hydroxy-tetrahydrodipicolinate synthase